MKTSTGPTQPGEFRLVLSPDSEAGWRARRSLRERFSDSLPAPTLIDLTAVVTELINNAVAHGPKRPITLVLELGGDAIRGEIADQGNPSTAIPRISERSHHHPQGLEVVDKLTSRWAVYEGSTHVWFEMPLQP